MRRTHALILTALAVLAILAYLPVLHQPLLEDDYPNLEQARLFGPVSGWPAMFEHTVFRYRATFYVLTYSLDRMFGPSAAAFYCAAILLHILCTWLVYALGAWRIVGWRISGAAAAFFAVAEGHQEAVMWYSASSELLMVFFGLLSLLCWVRFVDKQRGLWWYAASLASFVLALLSKESAVVFAALLWLPLWAGRSSRRALALWLPFVGLAVIEGVLIAGGSAGSFRFRDGSFSLGAPFWITLPVSYARLLWVWGLAALACIFLLRMKQHRQLLAMSAVWIAIALAPYSFLTYMHRIPSRQTYLASVGLAWIVAAGFWALRPRLRHRRPAALAAVIVLVFALNVGYLWTKKRDQFLRRAAPTEALIALARKTDSPIYMRCYPGPGLIYEGALRVRTGKPGTMLLWEKPANGAPAVDFCWAGR